SLRTTNRTLLSTTLRSSREHRRVPANPSPSHPADEKAVRALYEDILKAWNSRDGEAFAAPFAEDGAAIGFDGSEHSGRSGIAADMSRIFADHPTGRDVWKVRSVRLPGSDAPVLRAISRLVPAGEAGLAPGGTALP